MNPSDVRVIGIDPSLSDTGIAVLDGRGMLVNMKLCSEPACGTKVRERIGRFCRLVEKVMEIIDTEKPSIICIEGYSYGSSTGNVSDRVEYGGLLRLELCADERDIYEVVPTTLKKFASGKGKGDKTPVIAALTKRYGVVFDTDNEYDAYALARMALQIGGHEKPEIATQAEAINTVIHGSAQKQKKDAAKASKKRPRPAQLF